MPGRPRSAPAPKAGPDLLLPHTLTEHLPCGEMRGEGTRVPVSSSLPALPPAGSSAEALVVPTHDLRMLRATSSTLK